MTPVNPSDEAPRGEGMMSLEISGSDAPATSLGHHADSSKIAYQLPQPMRTVADALIVAGLAPGSAIAGVWFKPHNVNQGHYINILRVRTSAVSSRRHHGPVRASTLRGTWRYLEHSHSRPTST